MPYLYRQIRGLIRFLCELSHNEPTGAPSTGAPVLYSVIYIFTSTVNIPSSPISAVTSAPSLS
ncbi:MAG: hypothetical protein ILP19_04895, partial [Oscillospiraceae bacterium]|nr:hypothetical protein [Oscillospiraceae bacterium]